MSTLHLLWDESHLWGLLAARALKAYKIPFSVIRSQEVRAGILQQKPSVLLVPGGSARLKSTALGEDGLLAIRRYVDEGGAYLGFCGGAGLALTWDGDSKGLGLCQWGRGGFDERLQHFLSGHLTIEIPQTAQRDKLIPAMLATDALLPVWWPGRFAPTADPSIRVLATYKQPAADFWLADLPIAGLPSHMFKVWDDLYGVSIRPTFLEGEPCIIHGTYGKGSYTLSYSHLETPCSLSANYWFAHLLRTLGQYCPATDEVPAWNINEKFFLWEDDYLAEVEKNIVAVTATGLEHGMLFKRNDWLLGWRTGIAGAHLNNLLALVRLIREILPSEAAFNFWAGAKKQMLKNSRFFLQEASEYLLTERLAQTLTKTHPGTLPQQILKDRKTALFGSPMHPGGLYKELLEPLNTLAFMQLQRLSEDE